MKKVQLSIIVLAFLSLILSSCEQSFFAIDGEGDVVTQTLSVSDFKAIQSNGSFEVVITQGSTQEVKAVGHQNIIDRLETDVHNNTWEIELEHGNYRSFELTIYITVPEITEIELNGSGNIEIGTFESIADLTININGSGNITNSGSITVDNITTTICGSGNCELNTTSTSVNSSISGSGNISLTGSATNQIIDIIGLGYFSSFDCTNETSRITISGSGNCEVNTSNSLDVEIGGSGNVYYKGNPKVNSTIYGSGSVISM